MQSDACIVRPEHLGAQIVHVLLQVVVQNAGVDLVEEILPRLLGTAIETVGHEALDQLVDQGLHLYCVEIPHRVFTQKIEGDFVVLFQLDVLHSERAAANRVGLVFSLLVADSES